MTTEKKLKRKSSPPGMIQFASPEINYASQHAGMQLANFISFLESLEPRLERAEATFIAAAFLESLPSLCQQSPEVIKCLKDNAELLIKRRQ